MATGRITKRSIDALVASDSTQYLWDDELRGFGVRITTNGAKSYIYQYRMGGREATKRRYTIGRHGSPWAPNTARVEAERLAMLVGQGTDPEIADKERRRQAVDLAFSAYVDTFVDGYLKAHWKGWKLGKSMLEREAVPLLKTTPLPLIKRSHIVDVLDRLSDRPAVARLMHATLRKLFRWAVSRGDLERSPIEVMEAPRAPNARDRVLSDAELALAWSASETLGYPFSSVFKLLIATGQRREEVAAIDWSELSRNTATWTLPAMRAKNGKAHVVPLNSLAFDEIDKLADRLIDPSERRKDTPATWPQQGLIFTTTGKTPVSGHSRGKSRLDQAIKDTQAAQAKERGINEIHQLAPWRVHDIRRSVATGMQRLGVRFEVTEALLNHVSGSKSGVAGVYQRHDWAAEKRSALDAWAAMLVALVDPREHRKVVPIARRAS